MSTYSTGRPSTRLNTLACSTIDNDAGPVVRPYAVTGGRTEPADGEVLDLVAVVVAVGRDSEAGDDPIRQTPEHRKILRLCQRPVTVADIASDTALPVGVVRVLLGDLLYEDLIGASRQAQRVTDRRLLQKVLDGLNAL